MKITFIIANMWTVQCYLEHFQVATEPERRTVTIELTPEQVKQIGIRQIGVNCGKLVLEEIMDCFIESEAAQ